MRNKNLILVSLSLIFSALILYYINISSVDVAYSDYIRLINSYLPNVSDPKALLRADILTCIPIAFLSRFINVSLFSYSTLFDRVVGTIGLFLINIFIGRYIFSEKNEISIGDNKKSFFVSLVYFIICSFIVFSLLNWEMILNGTGYAHFLAIGLFIYSFTLLDDIYNIFQIDNFETTHSNVLKKNIFKFLVSYTVSSILLAGPYGMIPFVCVILFLLAIKFFTTIKSMSDLKKLVKGEDKNRKLIAKNSIVDKTLIICAIMPFICLMLYIISNHFAVYEYSGASDVGLFSVIFSSFPVKFILKSFASFIFGVESFGIINISEFLNNKIIYLIGAFVIFLYIYCTYLNVKYEIYKKTLFPMLLMIWSLGNVAIVFLSRYIFLNPNYGASSRYYLQYMVGVLGFILTFYQVSLINIQNKTSKLTITKVVIGASIVVILLSNAICLKDELTKSIYRKENYVKMKEAALDLDSYSDEELVKIFEYRKGAQYIKDAFKILKDNNLNIFKKENLEVIN